MRLFFKKRLKRSTDDRYSLGGFLIGNEMMPFRKESHFFGGDFEVHVLLGSF